jgi:AraC-like DNA-binding protein
LPPILLHPYNILELVFAFMAGFGALLIWNLPRYRSLAAFFIFQSVLMLLNSWEQLFTSDSVFLVTPVFTLAKGPLLYLVVRSMVNETRIEGFRLYGHFLPMLLALPLTVDPQFVVGLGTVSQLAYLAASFRLLYRYHSAARSFRSDAGALQLSWLLGVLGLFAAQLLIGLVRLNLQPRLSPIVANAWFTFDVIFLFGLCCFMLFKVLRHPLLYDDMLAYEKIGRQAPAFSDERESAEARNIFAALESLIVDKQLYQQARLTVDDISRETGLQVKDVSWAINLGSKQNFNEYINRLRVDDIKRQISAGQLASQSLLDLAFAAGFNSKSTFNAAFKREVGMTPTQFLNSKPT